MKTPTAIVGACCVLSIVAVARGSEAGQIPITTSSAEARAALPEGPRPRGEAARHRRAAALRAGGSPRTRLRAGAGRPRELGGHREGVLRRRRVARSRSRRQGLRAREARRLRARRGRQGRARAAEGLPDQARRGLPRRRARPEPDGRLPLRAPGLRRRRSPPTRRRRAIDPAFSQPYNQMGYAYRFLGKYDEAEQAFKKYIELIPGDPNPYDSYAELLMKMGASRSRSRATRRRSSVDPNFVASYIGIGNDRVFMGQPARGAQDLRQAAAVARNDGEKLAGALLDGDVLRARGRRRTRRVAEIEKMAAIDKAGNDQVALSGTLRPGGQHPARGRPRGRGRGQLQGARRDDRQGRRRGPGQGGGAAPGSLRRGARGARPGTTSPAPRRRPRPTRRRSARSRSRSSCGRATSSRAASRSPRRSYDDGRRRAARGQPAGSARALPDRRRRTRAAGDLAAAKQASAQAADFNGLSPTYGYVRGKAKAMLKTADKD